jgi:hypothetical protein
VQATVDRPSRLPTFVCSVSAMLTTAGRQVAHSAAATIALAHRAGTRYNPW